MRTKELLEDLLEKTSRTFALSIPRLPDPTRREVTIAYLMFRIADTLEDATLWARSKQLDELGAFAALLRDHDRAAAAELATRWLEEPPCERQDYIELLGQTPSVLQAFLELTEPARGLVREHTLRTTELMASFVSRRTEGVLQLGDVKELQGYCYAVAGIVGEMLTELFLIGRDSLQSISPLLRRNAARFGEALQLVNILKDSATDVREGRSYLPQGRDRAEVFALARSDLAAARDYVLGLQQAGAPRGLVAFTALPVLLAWSTLDRVEDRGPGAKLTRPEVAELVQRLEHALDHDQPAVPRE